MIILRRRPDLALTALATLLGIGAGPIQAQSEATSSSGRSSPHADVLAGIGRSGLRALLGAAGSLGDLQNRAGSYRMAMQLERARVGELGGRIAALERALEDPTLAPEERAALADLRDAARDELTIVPRRDAAYRAGTFQLETLRPMGMVAGRPMFLLVRGRGHARWGGTDGLTVFSEAVTAGPVIAWDGRWIASAGVSVGRTDVDIGRFDGSSHTIGIGPRLAVGSILADGWSTALQVGHIWSRGSSTIRRPGPGAPVEVRSEGGSRATSAQAEVRGHLTLLETPRATFALRPGAGVFVTTTHSPATTNSLGETGTGPFGERERLAALRVGVSVDARRGVWSPTLHLGWEEELHREMSVMVQDPRALLASTGLAWSWGRGRRVSLDYTMVRGLQGLRRVSELTLVLIIDG